MERQLGVRLFERSQREVCLTAAGEALLPEAEQAVRQFDAAQLGAQRAGRGDVGRIELGYVASAAFSGLLQQQVTRFSQSHPGVVLNIREQPMAESPALVRDGVLDIAYVRTPMDLPDELVAMDLHEEGFVLALPASSRLNELPQIMAARLATETFILPEQISGTLAVAAQGGFVPRLGPQPGSLVAVITLVSLGQGVALVPESVLQHITLPQVSYRRIADSQPTSCLTVLHRRFEKAPAVMRYIEALRTGQG